MKKLFIVLAALSALLLFSGCKSENSLFPYVSEVRRDILCGEADGYLVKAYLYECENPKIDDGKVGALTPYIRFILKGELQSEATYTLNFSLKGKDYASSFKINPLSGEHTLDAEIDDINFNTLTVTVLKADTRITIPLSSAVTEGTLSPEEAVKKIYENNSSLFDAYKNGDGTFAAEIRLKITVKDGKTYYFFGIADGKTYKAFLADGVSAEVLAVREVF